MIKMSDLVWKGFSKSKDKWRPGPSHKAQKRKHFRCMRRVIKGEVMVDGSVTVNDELPTEVGFLVQQQAESRLKARKKERENRVQYYQASNRHLHELKHCNNAPTVQAVFNSATGSWISSQWM